MQLEVRGTFRGGSPANLLDRHALSLAIHGKAFLHLEAHHVGVIIGMVRDVTIEDGISGIVLPIWRGLVKTDDHRAYTLGVDVAILVFPTLLEIEVDFGEVTPFHVLDAAEAGGTDAVGAVGHLDFIVEADGFGLLGERDAGIQLAHGVLGAGDGFVHLAQEYRAGGQYGDVDKAQHLDALHPRIHAGTIAVAALFGKDGSVGLGDAGHTGHDIGRCPRRTAQIPVGLVIGDGLRGADGILVSPPMMPDSLICRSIHWSMLPKGISSTRSSWAIRGLQVKRARIRQNR